MNVPARQNETSINAVSMAGGASGSKMAPQNLGEVVRFSEVMCRADIALPKHLRGNAGACMAVAMQALEWNMSPFAVASKSYSVGGAIAYEAQLIAAVVNTRSGIKGRLKYRFDGEGADLTCTVTGTLDGEECTYTSPPIGSITTKNSPLWKSDPQQQLGYFSARSWARRHCPEVILGVYDRDEAEQFRGPDRAKDVTPTFDPLSDEPASKPAEATEDAREGFDADFVTRETETLSTTENSDDSTLSSQAVSDDAGETPSSPAELDGDGESSSPSSPSEEEPEMKPVAEGDRERLIECARKLLDLSKADFPPNERFDMIKDAKLDWIDALPAATRHVQAIAVTAQAVVAGKRTRPQAVAFLEEMLGAAGKIGGDRG